MLASLARAATRAGAAAARRTVVTLPPVPYGVANGLPPVLSARALRAHVAYMEEQMERLNELTRYSRLELQPLVNVGASAPAAPARAAQIIHQTAPYADEHHIFVAAAECWNHYVVFQSMAPNGRPLDAKSRLAADIDARWDSVTGLRDAVLELAATHDGSGYVWLVQPAAGWEESVAAGGPGVRPLELRTTRDYHVPFVHGDHPLLALDLWEHAYILDFEDRRDEYAARWFECINWEFAAARAEMPLS